MYLNVVVFSSPAFLIITLSYTLCICFTLSSNDRPCLCPLPHRNKQQKLCLLGRVKGFKIEMKPAAEMGHKTECRTLAAPDKQNYVFSLSFIRGCDRWMRCLSSMMFWIIDFLLAMSTGQSWICLINFLSSFKTQGNKNRTPETVSIINKCMFERECERKKQT